MEGYGIVSDRPTSTGHFLPSCVWCLSLSAGVSHIPRPMMCPAMGGQTVQGTCEEDPMLETIHRAS